MPFTLEPIGYIETCFFEKFGIPRQPQLAPSARGKLVLVPPFNDPDTVLGLEQCSHVWLEFIFHQNLSNGWKKKVRPPRLGGNLKQGVFATRSSFRPNGLGLSVVTLDSIEYNQGELALWFSGVDLLSGTPIVDIKPYLPYVDCIPAATHSLAGVAPAALSVRAQPALVALSQHYPQLLLKPLESLLTELLSQDPRPAYHSFNCERLYAMTLHYEQILLNVRWRYELDEDEQLMIVIVDIKKAEI